jgi:hypothetical protein
MNGMLPPVPMYSAGLPKKACEAACMEAASHGATGGAFQPPMAESTRNSTCAPSGGAVSRVDFTSAAAFFGSSVGGRRKDSFTAVQGLSVLPAEPVAGRPSAPVTDSVGRQVLFSSSSTGSVALGRVLPAQGNSAMHAVPEHLGDRAGLFLARRRDLADQPREAGLAGGRILEAVQQQP